MENTNTNNDFVGDIIEDKSSFAKASEDKSSLAKTSEDKETEKVQSMEELLAKAYGPKFPKIGDVLEGKILDISKTEIHIDLPNLGSGVIFKREFGDDIELINKFKIGDKISASVIDLENENGEIELSMRKVGREQTWKDLFEKQEKGEIITVKIQEANRGGLLSRIYGVQAFMPVSQLTTEHYPRVEAGDKGLILEKLQEFIGKNMKVKVIDVDQREDKLIISEKGAYAEEQRKALSGYKVGDRVKGKITAVMNFGAFMKFDNLEGLIHISELDWKKIEDPRDVVRINEEVEAEIIAIDGSKISLSMKRLKEDPWIKNVEKYKIGQIVEGEVRKINPFGAFVKLDDKIQGLAHISELSVKPIKEPDEVLKVGDKKKFKILSIEPEDHRLGLSLRAMEEKETNDKISPFGGSPAGRQSDKQTTKSK